MKTITLALAALLLAAAAAAQTPDYPNRPVKLVAPFAPGGPVDVVARMLAPKLSERFGQQFYVENHPGGSGNIGTALVAKAPPDGYTVLVISSTLVVNPSLFSKLGFDTTTDLAPARSSASPRKSCWYTRPFRRQASKNSSLGRKRARASTATPMPDWERPAISRARCSNRHSAWTSSPSRSTAADPRSPRPSAGIPLSSSPRFPPPPDTSSKARCARSPSPARGARRRFPTCRRLR